MAEKTNDFTQGGIPKTIIRVALPMIGAQIINVLYSIVDKMYISRLPGIGTIAMTGVGVTFPLIMIISAFSMLAGMGGAPLCSIARGEKRVGYAERVMGNAFSLLLLFAVVLTVISLSVKTPVLYMIGASAETFPYANEYLSIYLCGNLFSMIALGMNPFINAQGFTRMGMLTVALGAVTNIILDPLFMFTFGMGVRGAALATILSQALSACWVLKFLTGKKTLLKLTPNNMRPDKKIISNILRLGTSTFTMNLTECLSVLVCNRTLMDFGGNEYVAVMTVISSVRQILMLPISGFGQGLQPVMGYNYGAKRYDRVRQSFLFSVIVSTCYATIACLITQFLPEFLIRPFNPDGSLIPLAIAPLKLYFSFFFVLSLQMSGQYSFVALGKSRQAVFFSLLRKAFIVAPFAYILPRVTNMGPMGVFAAEPISDIVGSLACFITFLVTVWPNLEKKQEVAS